MILQIGWVLLASAGSKILLRREINDKNPVPNVIPTRSKYILDHKEGLETI